MSQDFEVWISNLTGEVLEVHRVAGGYSPEPDGPARWASYDAAELELTNDEFDAVDGRKEWAHLGHGDDVDWLEVWLGAERPVLLRKHGSALELGDSLESVDRRFASYEAAVEYLDADGLFPARAPERSFYDSGSKYRTFLESSLNAPQARR